jgi:hypothetical protein
MDDSVRGMGGLAERRGAKVEIWVAKQRDGWQRDEWLSSRTGG